MNNYYSARVRGKPNNMYNIYSTSTPKVIRTKIACTKKCQLLNNPKEFNLLKRRCLIKTLKRLNAFETIWWRQRGKNTVTKRTVKLSLKGLCLFNKEFETGFIDREDCSCKNLFCNRVYCQLKNILAVSDAQLLIFHVYSVCYAVRLKIWLQYK